MLAQSSNIWMPWKKELLWSGQPCPAGCQSSAPAPRWYGAVALDQAASPRAGSLWMACLLSHVLSQVRKGCSNHVCLELNPSTQAAQGTPYIHMDAFVMCGDGNMGHRTQVWPGTQTVGVLLNKKSLCLLPFSQLVFVLGPVLDLVPLFGRMSGSADSFKGSLRCTKTHLSCSQKRKLSRSPCDLTKSDPMFEVPHFSLSSVCLQLWWLACLSSVNCM